MSLVSIIGLLITLILGFGITRLDFATGQDSYLNKSDQVYKDNVAYQSLFGGQAMLTVITMDSGHTVEELMSAADRQQFTNLHDTLVATNQYQGVITPLTVVQFSDSLIQSPDGNPTTSTGNSATTKSGAGGGAGGTANGGANTGAGGGTGAGTGSHSPRRSRRRSHRRWSSVAQDRSRSPGR